MIVALRAMFSDECATTTVEYGIVAAFLAVPFIAAAVAIISTAGGTLGNTTAGMQSVGVNPP